jgi:hypothetical protein
VHAAVADDDPDDTTYEHAHGGEVDVCSHAATELPLLDLPLLDLRPAARGQCMGGSGIQSRSLYSQSLSRECCARHGSNVYRCVLYIISMVSIPRSTATRYRRRTEISIMIHVDGGACGGGSGEPGTPDRVGVRYLSSAIRSGSVCVRERTLPRGPASQARHSGAGIAIRASGRSRSIWAA